MCGIFGIIKSADSELELKKTLELLMKQSSRRGSDSAGLLAFTSTEWRLVKHLGPPVGLIEATKGNSVIDKSCSAVFGQTRLATNGSKDLKSITQPIQLENTFLLHNGIILNTSTLAAQNDTDHLSPSDSYNFCGILNKITQEKNDLQSAIEVLLPQVEGTASLAAINLSLKTLCLASNTGDLHLMSSRYGDYVFASEVKTLRKVIDSNRPMDWKHIGLSKDQPFSISLNHSSSKWREVSLKTKVKTSSIAKYKNNTSTIEKMQNDLKEIKGWIQNIKRCRKCILPITLPGISMDEDGVCDQCRSYVPQKVLGHDKLSLQLPASTENNFDCVVSFSGGRDSSYLLHYLVREMKLKVATITYDWGLVTDLGRRNHARMLGALGINNFLIAADIGRKRSNVKKNLEAWVRSPHLGTIPLLMAGDKHYFEWSGKIKKELGNIPLVMGENPSERTQFKVRFANAKPKANANMAYELSLAAKLRLASFYGREFLKNPSFLNASLIDTVNGYMGYYFLRPEYLNFYNYVEWNESKVESTLADYSWEKSDEQESTWRIGDGTPPLYNYLYLRAKGFTEFDAYYSNLVRLGQIDRTTALSKATKCQQLQVKALQWYADIIGIDLESVRLAINSISDVKTP